MTLAPPRDDRYAAALQRPRPERRDTAHYASRPQVERRDLSQSFIAGYAATFFDGTTATQRVVAPSVAPNLVERIMPGAFDHALTSNQDVRALFNHDKSLILGRRSAGSLRLSVDDAGLRYVIVPDNTGIARRVVEHIRRGDIDGSSFGFIVRDEVFRRDGRFDVREIRSVDLIDVGPVTFPAFEATTAIVHGATARRAAPREKQPPLNLGVRS